MGYLLLMTQAGPYVQFSLTFKCLRLTEIIIADSDVSVKEAKEDQQDLQEGRCKENQGSEEAGSAAGPSRAHRVALLCSG